jgi:hypothetical protein
MGLEQSEEIPAYRRHTKSKAQVKLLREWFGINPNPTGPQLSEYAKLANLGRDQVRNWFINQRRRSRRPKSEKVPGEANESQNLRPQSQRDLQKGI